MAFQGRAAEDLLGGISHVKGAKTPGKPQRFAFPVRRNMSARTVQSMPHDGGHVMTIPTTPWPREAQNPDNDDLAFDMLDRHMEVEQATDYLAELRERYDGFVSSPRADLGPQVFTQIAPTDGVAPCSPPERNAAHTANPPSNVHFERLQTRPKEGTYLKLVRRPFLAGLAHILGTIQSVVSEEVQLFGSDNVLANIDQGPFLWLIKHEVTHDFIYLGPRWLELPNRPDIRIAKRTPPTLSLEALLDRTLFRGVVLPVRRMFMGDGRTDHKRRIYREENFKKFESIRGNFGRGVHAIIFPEGTAVTTGSISRIRSGCYNCCRVETPHGDTELIANIPVGFTIDLMSGKRNRYTGRPSHLAFIYPGKPFRYEPVDGLSENPTAEDVKRDIAKHARRVKDFFLDLNTFTAAQLAGEYILRKVARGDCTTSHEELSRIVEIRARRLSARREIAVDRALLDGPTRSRRIENLFHNLSAMGYVRDGRIDSARTLRTLEAGKKFRRDNPLLFCVNRIRQISSERPQLRSLLDTTFAEVAGS